MIAFIDDHRGAYGVEPICRMLPIAPSTYHAHAARRADPARVCIDDEGDVDEACPGRHIGEVGEPKRIRALRLELPIDVVQRARRRLVADRGSDRLAADHALQTEASHQPCHCAAGNVVA